MTETTYNHDNFIEKLLQIPSKKEQLKVLKTYMLSLPVGEFDAFMFDNLDKLGMGLEDLVTNNKLNKKEKTGLNNQIDATINLLQTMKQDSSFDHSKAA